MFPPLPETIWKLDEAWNSHDLDRILDFYSEDFALQSPHAARALGAVDGWVRGKEAVRAWWRRVLDRVPDLKSELVAVVPGVESASYVFRSSFTGELAVSVFRFDDAGRIREERFHS